MTAEYLWNKPTEAHRKNLAVHLPMPDRDKRRTKIPQTNVGPSVQQADRNISLQMLLSVLKIKIGVQ